MGTVDRITRLIRANINDALKKAEDPVKASGLMLEEMRDNIRSVKQYLVSALADLRRMEQTVERNQKDVERWRERARFALSKGEEDLARKALVRKRALEKATESLRAEILQQRANIETIRADLQRLEERLQDVREKRQRLVAQREVRPRPTSQSVTTPETPPIDEALTVPALDEYEAMVTKVEDLEATVSAMAEMYQVDELAKQLDELETESDVERELQRLREQMQEETLSR